MAERTMERCGRAKNEARVEEMVATTPGDSLTCISHNDDPVDGCSTKKPFNTAILHGDVASVDVYGQRTSKMSRYHYMDVHPQSHGFVMVSTEATVVYGTANRKRNAKSNQC